MTAVTAPLVNYDVDRIRRDFPLLMGQDRESPTIYLDSAATSLKPACVIDAVREFYEAGTANTGRGVHWLAEHVTDRFEAARETIAGWINAQTREVVFVSNCTAAIRLVAEGREWPPCVLVGRSEHHSNDLPWRGRGTTVAVSVDAHGAIDLEDLQRCLDAHRPSLVAVTMVSNALGTVQPLDAIIELAHQSGARVLVDASQAVAHRAIDVEALGCDFLCFSGHKMCGPSGVGVLYGKEDCLDELTDAGFGGGSVEEVHADGFTPREVPWRLESGTPNIEGVLGLAVASDYLDGVGMEAIERHVNGLAADMAERLHRLRKVTVHGPPVGQDRGPIVSFSVDGLESHAVARILSQRHRICVRSGYHCAQPLHESLGLPPTVRASLALYTHPHEVDCLVAAVEQLAVAL